MPPFGSDVHIVNVNKLPPGGRHAAAAIANSNFELAFLYSEYTGGQDRRWEAYTGRHLIGDFRSFLAGRSVTQESFHGTVRYSHLRVFGDPATRGAIDVSGCFDNSRLVNTDIKTKRAIPDRTPPDQHYRRFTDVVSRERGKWVVIGIYPDVFYPRAKECKP
jgi:hypothetical protein